MEDRLEMCLSDILLEAAEKVESWPDWKRDPRLADPQRSDSKRAVGEPTRVSAAKEGSEER